MSCVVRWWDVLFVQGMHFHQKMHVYLIFVELNECTW